jgi:hypothetical protein
MAKNEAKRARRLTAVTNGMNDGQPARRFEGDDLMVWATYQERARSLNQQMNEFIEAVRTKYNIAPNELPDAGGFIRPMQTRPMPLQVPQNEGQAQQGVTSDSTD